MRLAAGFGGEFSRANEDDSIGFVSIAAVALSAVLIVWFRMPETKPLVANRPANYLDMARGTKA